VIFLNELSFTSENTDDFLTPVLSTFAAVKAAKRIRDDIVVAGREPLSGVVLGDGTRSLAELLRGDRDQWRFLKSLDQSSPWDAFPGLTSLEVLSQDPSSVAKYATR